MRPDTPLLDFLHTVYIPSKMEYTLGSVLQMQVSIRVLERWAGRTLVEAAGGRGDVFLGNTRAVFLANYRDPRFFGADLQFLPRPAISK